MATRHSTNETSDEKHAALVRLDSAVWAGLTDMSAQTDTSVNALVNTACANFLATKATPRQITLSVSNYRGTVEVVRDRYADVIARLAGTKET